MELNEHNEFIGHGINVTWQDTETPPEHMGGFKKASKSDNHATTSPMWFWLYHPDEGVRPYQLQQFKYDKRQPYIRVLGQDKFSLVHWHKWAYLTLPYEPTPDGGERDE